MHTLAFVTMQSETTNPFVYLGYSLSQTVSDVVILQSDIHLCVIWRMTVRFPFISIKKQRWHCPETLSLSVLLMSAGGTASCSIISTGDLQLIQSHVSEAFSFIPTPTRSTRFDISSFPQCSLSLSIFSRASKESQERMENQEPRGPQWVIPSSLSPTRRQS